MISLKNLQSVIMEISEEGSPRVNILSRRQLVDLMLEKNDLKFDEKLDYIENYVISYANYSEQEKHDIKQRFSSVKLEIKRRWSQAKNQKEIFYEENSEWLDGTFELPKVAQLSSEKVFKEVCCFPRRSAKDKPAGSTQQRKCRNMSPLGSLALFVEAGFTKYQYTAIRDYNETFFPPYEALVKEKSFCYPQKNTYEVTATSVEIDAQSLLNHTVERLLTSLENVLPKLSKEERKALTLTSKWGCDGSQQTRFRETFVHKLAPEENIFQCSIVPLELNCVLNGKKLLWRNPMPYSSRYCRPIRVKFIKEAADVVAKEIDEVSKAINSLESTTVTLKGRNFTVKHDMHLIMVDSTICNATNKTVCTKCYICGAATNYLNNAIEVTEEEVNPNSLQFGLSVLHLRIRLFENLLHLLYELTARNGNAENTEVTEMEIKVSKLQVQEEFKSILNLNVDIPKPGFGNTNDGYTSRVFFDDPDDIAEMTELDRNLIYRLSVILQTITCGHKVDIDKFAKYGRDTAKLYVDLYPWYPMSLTMHMILVHGATVIQHALLPIGELSWEAAEARNNYFQHWEDTGMPFSRETCNMEVIKRLLVASDPLVSRSRMVSKIKTRSLLKETMEMVLLEASRVERNKNNVTNSSSESESDGFSGDDVW